MPKGHNKSETIEAFDGYVISYIKVECCWKDGTNGSCQLSPNCLNAKTDKVQVKVEGLAFRGINWKVVAY